MDGDGAILGEVLQYFAIKLGAGGAPASLLKDCLGKTDVLALGLCCQ